MINYYDNFVIKTFENNEFKWFDNYDDCADMSIKIRKQLELKTIDDEILIKEKRKSF